MNPEALQRASMQATRQRAQAPNLQMPTPEPWMDEALCAQFDADMFYPEKGGTTRPAKRVCRECDVRSECLLFALANGERYGIWGGLSERERRRILEPTGHRRRGDKRPRVHLCQEPGCDYAAPTPGALDSHRRRAHRVRGAA